MNPLASPFAEVSFEVTEADYVETQMRMMTRNPTARRNQRRNVRMLAGLSLLVLGVVGRFVYMSSPDPDKAIVRVAIWFVVWGGFNVKFFWNNLSWPRALKYMRHHVRKAIRKGLIPLPRGPAKVTLTETHVMCSDGQTLTGFEWGRVTNVEVEAGAVCFDAESGVIRVPAEAFAGEADVRRFYETASELWQVHHPERATTAGEST